MADEKFELVSSYQPTGDQPQAIETLVKGVERGDRCQTLLGVTGSGKTFTMANVIAKCNRPTLVLAHNKTLAAQLCTEFRSFFPNNAVEYFVADEVLHRIVGEKRAELGTQLCRQRFVVRQHQRGAVALGNDVGHGKGFAAAGHAQQGLAAVTPLHPLHQLRDRLRLVTGGGIVRHQFKFFLCHRFLPSVRITTIRCCFKLYYSTHNL